MKYAKKKAAASPAPQGRWGVKGGKPLREGVEGQRPSTGQGFKKENRSNTISKDFHTISQYRLKKHACHQRPLEPPPPEEPPRPPREEPPRPLPERAIMRRRNTRKLPRPRQKP